jgi:predicted dienelactone hydrolase
MIRLATLSTSAIPNQQSTRFGLMLGCLGFWLLSAAGITNSAVAAERIYASYAAIERYIAVAELETYAKEGKLDDDLAVYAQYIDSQQLAELRSILVTRIDLGPVAVSQFLYTPIGESLLERLGQLIQTESRQPGFYALRSAMILAAATPEGLTLLNVLRHFPTRSIRIDVARSFQAANELERLINQTNRAIALVSQQSSLEAATAQKQMEFSHQPDIRLRGQFSWNKQTLSFYDNRRQSFFLADIYLPLTSRERAPVIVISHGLGSDRTSFKYLATHLASYGFAVAVPEHTGSDAEQVRSLLAGRGREVTKPNDLLNRPLDVKYLLDELERLDTSDPNLQLNLQQVGVIGQSLGGYTALSLAGASLDFKQLQNDCEELNHSWNLSLLLQCRGFQLPRTQYNLHDQRVKAAIAVNPITSSVFGEAGLSQIRVPVMLIGSSSDTFAPALSEQILPFTWLTTPEKYLALLKHGTHFSTIGESDPATELLSIPSQIIGPDPTIARRYLKALSVAFFQTYVAGMPQYRPYLSASYTQAISQAPLNLSLVQSLPANQLTRVLDSFKTRSVSR